MDASTVTTRPATPKNTAVMPALAQPRGLAGLVTACVIGAGLDNLFRQVAIVALGAAAVANFPDDTEKAGKAAAAYGAWALMLAGFGALGAALRRRRSSLHHA